MGWHWAEAGSPDLIALLHILKTIYKHWFIAELQKQTVLDAGKCNCCYYNQTSY
jgi:hypothetical protein